SQPLSNKSDQKKKVKKTDSEKPVENQIIDLSLLTVEELFEEVNKRVQDSPDTNIKRQLSRIVERKTLPAKRRGFTYKAKVGGQPMFLRTRVYSDDTICELFIDMPNEGSTLRSLLNSFAIAVYVRLQYGVPLKEYVDKLIFTRFEPSCVVEHPKNQTATSELVF